MNHDQYVSLFFCRSRTHVHGVRLRLLHPGVLLAVPGRRVQRNRGTVRDQTVLLVWLADKARHRQAVLH